MEFSIGIGMTDNPNQWVLTTGSDGGQVLQETPNRVVWNSVTWRQRYTFPSGSTPTRRTFACSTVEEASRNDVRHRQNFDYPAPPNRTVFVRARGVASDGTNGPWSEPRHFRGCGIEPPERFTAQEMTGQFVNPHEPHDGTAFDARLELSLEPAAGFSYRVFQGDASAGRASALQITNGTVQRARRDGAVQNRKWIITILPSGTEAVTITLPATTDCGDVNAICSAGGAMLQQAVTKVVPGPGPEIDEPAQAPALTVAYTTRPPAEHDGSAAFEFQFEFSENLKSSYGFSTMRDDSLRVRQGGSPLTPYVKRKVAGGGNNQAWVVTVTPNGNGDISVALPATPDCSATGAMCTGDNRGLSTGLSATVQGPPGLSVADARVEEAQGATVDFTVTLSRAASATATVDYATSNGTATAGSDYTETRGTLTFAAGDTTRTVSVPVLDDAVDEDAETFTLTLSNADGAYLVDSTATGTITNNDAMPKAWLARFGRTVASHAVEAVGARLEGGGGSHVTVAGVSVPLAGQGAVAGRAERAAALLEAFASDEDGDATQSMTARNALLGSAFQLSAGGEGGAPAWTAWGRITTGGFEAEMDDTRLNGDVTSGFVGADIGGGGWLAGLALGTSRGSGDFALIEGGDGGSVESTLNAVYPYAQARVSDTLAFWGLAGVGAGDLTLTLDADGERMADERYHTDVNMRMGAIGARGEVLSPAEPGDLTVAIKSDAFWVRTSSDAVRSATGNLGASEADVSRIRLTAESSLTFETAGDGTMRPTLEVGVRHDGGDAETGTGVEAGAGLAYTAGALTVDARVRVLLAHEQAGYEEWGMSGSIRIDPGASGRGSRSRSRPRGARRAAARGSSGRSATPGVSAVRRNSRPADGSTRRSATASVCAGRPGC